MVGTEAVAALVSFACAESPAGPSAALRSALDWALFRGLVGAVAEIGWALGQKAEAAEAAKKRRAAPPPAARRSLMRGGSFGAAHGRGWEQMGREFSYKKLQARLQVD